MSSPSCGSALFVVGTPTGTSLTLTTAVVGIRVHLLRVAGVVGEGGRHAQALADLGVHGGERGASGASDVHPRVGVRSRPAT